MKNINYKSKNNLTPWRKVSLASWRPTGDSSTYCLGDLDMEDALLFCKEQKVSLYSLVIKALSLTIEKHPKINATVRWWNIREREDISVFFHTMKDAESDDLSGILLENGQKKSLEELNHEFLEKINKAKEGENEHNESKKIVGILPAFLTRPLMNLYAFIVFNLNWNLAAFKSPKNSFGSIMLTATGSLGIGKSLCPIAPYTRVPMVVSFGTIEKRPVVINDELVVRKMATFGFTFDHRIMDGIHFSEFFSCFKQFVVNPEIKNYG